MNYAEISSNNLRALLARDRISLRQLAAELGVSASTLSDAMRSRHGLSIDLLAAAAVYFSISLDALCDPAFDSRITGSAPMGCTRCQLLDAHGKKVVDTVLTLELERCAP